MIHLDTSFLIHALLPASRADKRLRQWLRAGEDLAISSVAWAEFLCGPVGAAEVAVARDLFREIMAFTPADSETTAQLFNVGGRRRGYPGRLHDRRHRPPEGSGARHGQPG